MNKLNYIYDILKQNNKYVDNEGDILKSNVQTDAMNLDEDLLKLLISNTETKNMFFKDINGTLVFDKISFCWVINNRMFLPDSYTSFKNKIGLIDENRNYISNSNDIVLSFPYKDCILEGGQTKEDQKRKEVFFNETLMHREIDTLLAPKSFSNAIKYDLNGNFEINIFDFNDNMLIKGNNLLILESLLPVYKNKIKLIYIDPPYNTGSDTFSYNDNFNRSSWLTFMKNRLEIAKKLLSDDGAIYVQLDYHQVHYAKVLMDEIFGEDNFQREIIWRIGWLSGYKTKDNNWIRNHDTILFYSKNFKNLKFNKFYIPKNEFKRIAKSDAEKYPIEDVWNGNEYDDLNSIAIVSFSGETVSKMLNPGDEVKGQKSEKLLERIIKAHTKEGDIVLDFFAGTGTTGAVSMKMNRKFILCEQLDEHLDICKRRLQNVIKGEQSGVSKKNNWLGGGSFTTFELAKLNEIFIEKINLATDDNIDILFKDILSSDFITYKTDLNKISDNVENFKKLSLDDKKKILIEILDKNMLYINYSDIDDESYNVPDKDKKFTKSFYEGK